MSSPAPHQGSVVPEVHTTPAVTELIYSLNEGLTRLEQNTIDKYGLDTLQRTLLVIVRDFDESIKKNDASTKLCNAQTDAMEEQTDAMKEQSQETKTHRESIDATLATYQGLLNNAITEFRESTNAAKESGPLLAAAQAEVEQLKVENAALKASRSDVLGDSDTAAVQEELLAAQRRCDEAEERCRVLAEQVHNMDNINQWMRKNDSDINRVLRAEVNDLKDKLEACLKSHRGGGGRPLSTSTAEDVFRSPTGRPEFRSLGTPPRYGFGPSFGTPQRDRPQWRADLAFSPSTRSRLELPGKREGVPLASPSKAAKTSHLSRSAQQDTAWPGQDDLQLRPDNPLSPHNPSPLPKQAPTIISSDKSDDRNSMYSATPPPDNPKALRIPISTRTRIRYSILVPEIQGLLLNQFGAPPSDSTLDRLLINPQPHICLHTSGCLENIPAEYFWGPEDFKTCYPDSFCPSEGHQCLKVMSKEVLILTNPHDNDCAVQSFLNGLNDEREKKERNRAVPQFVLVPRTPRITTATNMVLGRSISPARTVMNTGPIKINVSRDNHINNSALPDLYKEHLSGNRGRHTRPQMVKFNLIKERKRCLYWFDIARRDAPNAPAWKDQDYNSGRPCPGCSSNPKTPHACVTLEDEGTAIWRNPTDEDRAKQASYEPKNEVVIWRPNTPRPGTPTTVSTSHRDKTKKAAADKKAKADLVAQAQAIASDDAIVRAHVDHFAQFTTSEPDHRSEFLKNIQAQLPEEEESYGRVNLTLTNYPTLVDAMMQFYDRVIASEPGTLLSTGDTFIRDMTTEDRDRLARYMVIEIAYASWTRDEAEALLLESAHVDELYDVDDPRELVKAILMSMDPTNKDKHDPDR